MKFIHQFAYKNGMPTDAGPVVDCRTITNPWRLGSTPEQRREKVRAHPDFEAKVTRACDYLKRYDSIAVGCLHGQDRSGAVAEEVSKRTGATVLKGQCVQVK